METGSRTDLEASCISALPKLDIQQTVLDYVKNLRYYSKVHAAEGRAYVSSWGKKDTEGTANLEMRSSRSCGFATPVLKPRNPVAVKEKTRKTTEVEDATRNITSAKNLTKNQKTHSMDTPKHIGAKARQISTSTKPSGATRSKEPPTRRESRTTKRTRELQSDEEKRLQERREKKKARRDIMRSQSPKEPDESGYNDDNTDALKNKKVKTKQKLPPGLALMYGFSATNIGKNRLTVDPPLYSGVFGKGKASAQMQTGKSKSKSKLERLAFSEAQFLTSAGKFRPGSMQSSSTSRSSASSESRADSDIPKQNLSARKGLPSTSQRTTDPDDVPSTKKDFRKNIKSSTGRKESGAGDAFELPSEKAQSVLWDIEKDSGVLPTEDSSLLSHGPNSSTVLVNVSKKPWMRSPPFHGDKVFVVEELSDQKTGITDAMKRHLTPEEDRRSPSVISSLRPSESPSQVPSAIETGFRKRRQETRSNYFAPMSSPPPVPQPPEEEPAEIQAQTPVLNPVQIWQDTVSTQSGQRQPPLNDEESMKMVQHHITAVADVEEGAHVLQDTVDSDWLLSDPVLNALPCETGNTGEIESSFFGDRSSVRSPPKTALLGKDIPYLVEEFFLAGESDNGEYLEVPGLPKEIWFGEASTCNGILTASGEEFYLPKLGTEGPMDIGDTFTESFAEDHYYSRYEKDLDETISQDSNSISSVSSGLGEQKSEPCGNSHKEVTSAAVPGSLLQFNEGRLLLGGGVEALTNFKSGLQSVEADVARRLVGHWAPQRF